VPSQELSFNWSVEEWTKFMKNKTLRFDSRPPSLRSNFAISLSGKNIGDEESVNLAEALALNTSIKTVKYMFHPLCVH
jgi:hypothetical protein